MAVSLMTVITVIGGLSVSGCSANEKEIKKEAKVEKPSIVPMDLKAELPRIFKSSLSDVSGSLKSYTAREKPILDKSISPITYLWPLPGYQGLKVDLWYLGEVIEKITFKVPSGGMISKEFATNMIMALGFSPLQLQEVSESETHYSSSLEGVPVLVVMEEVEGRVLCVYIIKKG